MKTFCLSLILLVFLPGCWLNEKAASDLAKDEEKAVIDFVEDEIDSSSTST